MNRSSKKDKICISEELETHENDDDANKKQEFLQGVAIETEEKSQELEENSANISTVYNSNENAATNSEGDAPSTLNIAVSQADSSVDPNNEEPRKNIEQHGFVSDKVKRPLIIQLERIQCEHGGTPFSRELHEVRHSRILSGKKQFTCDICKKQFTRKCSLVYHTRTHTGDKPFSCEICLKVFSRKYHLKSHMRTHTGEKPFKCEDCGKAFTRKQILKEHAAVHIGEKPFKCELCDRFFVYSANLRHHQRTHKAK